MAEQEKNPVQEMFPGVYAAASLIVIGRKIILDSLNKYPYFPDVEDLTSRMWSESGVNFWNVPSFQRRLIAEGSRQITPVLLRRVKYQQKFFEHPKLITENLVGTINQQLNPQARLDVEQVKIAWGMFSFGLVLNTSNFDRLLNTFDKHQRVLSPDGYVTGQLIGDLGLIPLIKKGKQSRATILHEDLHAVQAALGYLKEIDLDRLLVSTDILRIFTGEDIRPGDLALAKIFLRSVAANADQEMFIELQTNLWEGRNPYSDILTGHKFGYPSVSMDALFNSIYHPSSNLTDTEKIEETFYGQRAFNSILEKGSKLAKYADYAKNLYHGPLPAQEWVAALSFVIPANTPLETMRAMMLGARHMAIDEPPRNIHADLAGAIVTFAKRKLKPESWGSGDPLEEQRVEEFVKIVSEIFNGRSSIEKIVKDNNFTTKELEDTKAQIVKYGIDNSPEEQKAKTQQLLNVELKA